MKKHSFYSQYLERSKSVRQGLLTDRPLSDYSSLEFLTQTLTKPLLDLHYFVVFSYDFPVTLHENYHHLTWTELNAAAVKFWEVQWQNGKYAYKYKCANIYLSYSTVVEVKIKLVQLPLPTHKRHFILRADCLKILVSFM